MQSLSPGFVVTTTGDSTHSAKSASVMVSFDPCRDPFTNHSLTAWPVWQYGHSMYSGKFSLLTVAHPRERLGAAD